MGYLDAQNSAHAAASDAPTADESVNLPLVDISEENLETGKALIAAAERWGFLWIVASAAASSTTENSASASDPSSYGNGDGHEKMMKDYDFDEETVNDIFALSKRFFLEAGREEKEAVAYKNNRGWIKMHVENLDPSQHSRGDFKQAFNLAEPVEGVWQQNLPETFVREQARLKDFHARCRSMATRILRLIAMGLEIEDVDWLARTHEQPTAQQTTRFLYYPALPPDTDYDTVADIRAGAHSDYGSITLLFQRPAQPGLEILKPNGSWASVPVFPPNYHSSTFPPILVNIGDLLSYWTNGMLKSTIHRVILSDGQSSESESKPVSLGEDRFSIAVFLGPQEKCELVPMPSKLVAVKAEQFTAEGGRVGHGGGATQAGSLRTLTAGEHLSNRLRATYGAVYEPEVTASG